MYAVLNGADVVVACGPRGDFVPPAGGRVVETDTDPLATLGADQEAFWDGAAFVARARTLSAEETQFRQDVQTVKAFLAAPNGSATDAQRDAALKAFIRVARRMFRELAD